MKVLFFLLPASRTKGNVAVSVAFSVFSAFSARSAIQTITKPFRFTSQHLTREGVYMPQP